MVPDGLSPGAFSAAYIVSYGPSRKDTLTISSTEGQETVLALQREIVTLSGALLEPQEIPFRGSGQLSSLEQVALAGILLALGVPPENLGV